MEYLCSSEPIKRRYAVKLERATVVMFLLAAGLALAAGISYLQGSQAEAASDNKAPTSKITDPKKGAVIPAALWSYSIKGGASDGRRGSGVLYVEVSTDGGSSWNRATDRSADGSWKAWSYRWPLDFSGEFILRSRAADKAGNVESPRASVKVTVVR